MGHHNNKFGFLNQVSLLAMALKKYFTKNMFVTINKVCFPKEIQKLRYIC